MKIFAKGWSMNKDGPGHRRIYYLKGCNLRCLWCASPESISGEDELLFYPDRAAVEEKPDFLCPHGAISGKSLDRAVCRKCVNKECRSLHHRCLVWAGENVTADDICRELEACREMWGNLAGVTFGGGESALQSGELTELFNKLHEMNIHTAFESNAVPEGFKDLVCSADLVITDLKAGSPETFFRCTGGNLDKVTEHHLFAAEMAGDLLIRIPLIPTLNDSKDEFSSMLAILKKLHARRMACRRGPLAVELLKFHHFGQAKYAAMGIAYPAAALPDVPAEKIAEYQNILARSGIRVVES
jgi:pyruvate formate lyase activating enzyme